METLTVGRIFRGTLKAGKVLRLTASGDYTGFAFLDQIGPDSPRFPLSAGDNLLLGPYMQNRPVRIDVTGGAVEIDLDHRSPAPQLATDHIGVNRAVDAQARPAAFDVDGWTLTADELKAVVGIEALPAAGFSVITDIEYMVDGGTWISSGGMVGFDIEALTAAPHTVAIRAVNFIGAGPPSDIKVVTPTAE